MLTPSQEVLLADLRSHSESITVFPDGSHWGDVYLPNVDSSHRFAGLLSSLKVKGFYKPVDRYFGWVKM